MIESRIFFETTPRKIDNDPWYAKLQDEIKAGASGYYRLPVDQEGLLHEIEAFKQERLDLLYGCENIVVVGIGGSSLGSKAIHNALKYRKSSKRMLFLESSDPLQIDMELGRISLEKSVFIIISKSGSTIETISLFKYILQCYGAATPKEAANRLIFITDKGSALEKLGVANGVKTFGIDANVGGRFSVLSAVGLVPLALAGYDVRSLLEGAKALYEQFVLQGNDRHGLLEKAAYFVENHDEITINVLFTYTSLLKDFNAWYVQLWGESLGKVNRSGRRVGLTPIGIIGPVDQHSFLQLIMEGPRNKSVTFIKIAHSLEAVHIPEISLPGLESTDYANGVHFETLIGKQCDATREALESVGVPTDIIELEALNEDNMGYIMYYYELLTSLVGIGLDINTYDQPGVEIGKVILQEKFRDRK